MEYVALFTPVSQDQAFSWPATKKTEFWDKCADAISCSTGKQKRSGTFLNFVENGSCFGIESVTKINRKLTMLHV